MGFDAFAFSLQMRDTIDKMVASSINKLRPAYRYASVTAINQAGSKCTVIYNGETNPVIVNMGTIQPSAIGQTVRIEGMGTDKFVTDVIGWSSPATLATGINLNSYIQTGTFYQSANGNATLVNNYPIAMAGLLEVTATPDGYFVFQRYTCYADFGRTMMFVRSWYNGFGWNEWHVASDGMKQSQRNYSWSNNSGACYDTASVFDYTFPILPMQTLVQWTVNGHCGYPSGTTAIQLSPVIIGSGTIVNSSYQQDMGVAAGAWIACSESGAILIPAGATCRLIQQARVSGGQYAYWRANMNMNRTYWP